MRAVNVGGFQACRPSVLAKKLEDLNVVNIGAAGTFVVKEKVGEIEARLNQMEGGSFNRSRNLP